MAKKPQTAQEASSPVETISVQLPADFTISAHGLTLSAADLVGMSPKAISYVVANGYKQSITDAAAFTKEQKSGKSENELADMANEARSKRHAAILAGEVGSVGGTRATPIERYMRDVAEERVRSIAVARGVPMPKGDLLKAAIAKVTERFADDIRADAEARMATNKAAAEAAADVQF